MVVYRALLRAARAFDAAPVWRALLTRAPIDDSPAAALAMDAVLQPGRENYVPSLLPGDSIVARIREVVRRVKADAASDSVRLHVAGIRDRFVITNVGWSSTLQH